MYDQAKALVDGFLKLIRRSALKRHDSHSIGTNAVMQLSTFHYLDLDKLIVTDTCVGKLYYVHDGRNAWYSTWVLRYFDGCMHTTLSSAMEYAERRRVQGSVFYIVELPTLLIEGVVLVLAVTQINTEKVLSAYSTTALRNEEKGSCAIQRLSFGTSISTVYRSFNFDSPFWHISPPRKDSVIRVFGKGKISDFEKLDVNTLKRYRSRAVGVSSHLKWTEERSSLDCKEVNRLSSQFRSPKA